MNGFAPRSPVISLFALLLVLAPAAAQAPYERRSIAAGPLALDVSISRTANVFHVVDQISGWSQYCHRQYKEYFEKKAGGLSKEDRDLLAEHAKVRASRGWGGGLEQTLYTSLDLEAALADGVKRGNLKEEEAKVELRVLSRFGDRVDRLLSQEAATLRSFADRIAKDPELGSYARTMADFFGADRLEVPVQLIANPSETSMGGGFSGGCLTLEISRGRDAYPTLLHEIFHAFQRTKWGLIETSARGAKGLDIETLSEGMAYAYNPGLVHDGPAESDPLRGAVADYMRKGSALSESYARFNTYGLALRPLLKDALGRKQTVEDFLPRAADAWRALVELEAARTAPPAKK
jgi:hypothetical protein